MRSLLFVPADSESKLAKAGACGADAVILDLEDSVAADRKSEGRRLCLAYLRAPGAGILTRFVRVNPPGSGMMEADLAAVIAGRPAGIMLPKCAGADEIRALDIKLAEMEKHHHIEIGSTRILPIVTETAASVFALGGYAGASARLCGLMWGAEDLAADIGAAANRRPDGTYDDAFRLARALCLLAAAAAGVPAIDTVFPDFKDLAGLRSEAEAALRSGFAAKAAIHPTQIEVINRAFTPDAAQLAWARRVVEGFAAAPGAGVIAIDGRMLDRPHLKAAERLLARAATGAKSSP